jgi:hypothetical protein
MPLNLIKHPIDLIILLILPITLLPLIMILLTSSGYISTPDTVLHFTHNFLRLSVDIFLKTETELFQLIVQLLGPEFELIVSEDRGRFDIVGLYLLQLLAEYAVGCLDCL